MTQNSRPETACKPRLLVLSSHAIQYLAPLFRVMARDPRFSTKVAFCSDEGARVYKDPGFGREIKWDVPLLEGYEHEQLRNLSPIANPSRFWGLVNPGIIARIWNGKHDALLLLSWSNATVWMAVLAAWIRGLPILLKPEANVLSPTKPWRAFFKKLILGFLFRRMHRVLASGKYGLDFFRSYDVPDDKLTVAPYAVDNDYFLARAAELALLRRDLRTKHGIPAGLPVILFVGKLYPHKRPADLLQAFAAVRKEVPAALLLVGDGESRPALEASANEAGVQDVYFAGFRNQSELPEFLALADIFVLPSMLETWGLVVNEAMCFGLPVIVTDRVGAGGDLVKNGENGYVYPVGDVSTLGAHLRTLISDADLRLRMGAASLKMIGNWSYRQDLDVIAESLRLAVPASSLRE